MASGASFTTTSCPVVPGRRLLDEKKIEIVWRKEAHLYMCVRVLLED